MPLRESSAQELPSLIPNGEEPEITGSRSDEIRQNIETLLSAQLRLFLLWMMMTAMLSGCMYKPNHFEQFEEPEQEIGLKEQWSREREINNILYIRNPHHLPGDRPDDINQIQIDRIKSQLEPLLTAKKEDFEQYTKLWKRLKEDQGIYNIDRYTYETLQEADKTFHNPEYRKDDKLVIVIGSRNEHDNNILGIQALNVDSHRIDKLRHATKMTVVETSCKYQINSYLRQLRTSKVLRKGKLKGILVVSHMNRRKAEAGLDVKNIRDLIWLNEYFAKDDECFFVISGCKSGEGRENDINLVNAFGMHFPGVKVMGCDGRQLSADADVDEKGNIIADSIALKSWGELLMLGNNTYQYDDSQLRPWARMAMHNMNWRKQHVSSSHVQACLKAGITNTYVIRSLHREKLNIQTYLEYSKLGLPSAQSIKLCLNKGYSVADLETMVNLGVNPLHLSIAVSHDVREGDIRRAIATRMPLHMAVYGAATEKLMQLSSAGR